MSQADAERFVADLKNDEGLRAELSGHASGRRIRGREGLRDYAG